MANVAELQLQMRRGVSGTWTSNDPVLLAGELGYETDTGFWKVGDGSTAWSALTYAWFFGGDITVNGDIIVTGTVDGRDVAADGAILDALEDNVITLSLMLMGG